VRSLFVKIFLSFWLAQALFLVLAILITLGLRSQRESATWEALQAKVLAEAVQLHASGGEDAVRRYLDDMQDTQHLHAYLFNELGKEVSGARPPEFLGRMEREGTRPSPSILSLLTRGRFLRQSVNAADGHRYTLIMELQAGPRVLFGPRGIPGLALLIAVISSGLVCYILARYMTAPVVRLRDATQRLAAGDLTARAGTSWGGAKRRDEISQLVRDFDAMAERLEGLVKAQGRLLNDISHELRSPLARLNVALGLARQRTGPEAQASLERIDLEAERLNELIGRLLTIARLESREDPSAAVSVDLDELVSEIANDAEFEAQNRGCRVKTTLAGDCVVKGNAQLLRSAVENVIRNATRYTPEGTAVHVNLSCVGDANNPEAILQVTDEGPGVPEESLEKLFEPFYRIDDSRVRQTGGVGLGLAITKRAVRLHAGTVRAMNRPEGGLLVEIRLPLVAQPEPVAV
jgi:two-component system, OmpR family, sensor histidine kinase CpxA